jgi:transcriptional regulator GlxA family with amidase domain
LERSQTPKNKSDRPSQVNEARIEMAVELMEKNLTRKISREEITKATGLSYSHFSNLFHRQTGHSPMEYLSHLRIQKAKVLLEDLRLSIKEVSTLCGFDDPYYFSKVFTHLEGRSPTQYREILAGNGVTPKVHRKTSSKSRA